MKAIVLAQTQARGGFPNASSKSEINKRKLATNEKLPGTKERGLLREAFENTYWIAALLFI